MSIEKRDSVEVGKLRKDPSNELQIQKQIKNIDNMTHKSSLETVESQEYDENVTTRWCTFEDFKKYCYRNLTDEQMMEEW